MKYFNYNEFDSPDFENSGRNMDSDFIAMLDNAREIAGVPFKITSGFRTKEYNEILAKKGYKASPNSSHLRGLAVDIAATDSVTRFKIVSAALQAGINRIGIANTFIHLDCDTSKTNSVIWTY